jgi:hypothetical protein
MPFGGLEMFEKQGPVHDPSIALICPFQPRNVSAG